MRNFALYSHSMRFLMCWYSRCCRWCSTCSDCCIVFFLLCSFHCLFVALDGSRICYFSVWYHIISFVLYDYYPLGVSFLFYFANSTYNYRAALPIKRAKGGEKNRIVTTTTKMFIHLSTAQYQYFLITTYERIRKERYANEEQKKTCKYSAFFRVAAKLVCLTVDGMIFFPWNICCIFVQAIEKCSFLIHVWLLLWVLFYVDVKRAAFLRGENDRCKFSVTEERWKETKRKKKTQEN